MHPIFLQRVEQLQASDLLFNLISRPESRALRLSDPREKCTRRVHAGPATLYGSSRTRQKIWEADEEPGSVFKPERAVVDVPTSLHPPVRECAS